MTPRPGWSAGCRSAPTAARRPRCCPSRCATPTARPPPPRSTSRPRATACPTSCPGRSSSSTPARAPPARSPTTSPRPTAARYASRPAVAPTPPLPVAHRRTRTATTASRSSAPAGFRGPGSVLVEVTTATDASGNEDTTTTDDGVTAILSIPVVVGTTPRRSSAPPASSRCRPASATTSTSTPTARSSPSTPATPTGSSSPRSGARPSTASTSELPQGSVVRVTASDAATEGGEAVLVVRAGESNPQEIRFRLAEAPAAAAVADQRRDHGGRAEPHLRHARLPRGRRREPRSQDRDGAEHRLARREGERRRQPAHADRGPRHPRRGGELPAGRQRRRRRRPAVLAHGRRPDRVQGHRHAVAARGAAALPAARRGRHHQDGVGAARRRRRGTGPLLPGARGEDRRQAAVRHQRVRLPQAEERRQLQLPCAGGQPRGRQRLEQPVALGAGRHAARPGAEHPDDRPRRRADHHRLGQAADQHLADPRLHHHVARRRPRGRRRQHDVLPRDRAWTTTSSTSFTIKAQNQVGYSLPRTSGRDAAPRHAAGTRRAGRDRPRVRRQARPASGSPGSRCCPRAPARRSTRSATATA